MRRKTINIKLNTIETPCHTFDEGEFITILPRHALPMGVVEDMIEALKQDRQSSTATWLRECFRQQVHNWHLNLDGEDVPVPKESDAYEKLLDKGVIVLFAALISQLRIGNEIINTEWGSFSIAPDGVCTMVPVLDDDEKKS